ncbi:hypothetical protein PVAND_009634 [Polypedilum vanderplanki]|uniref:Uncharacterized protein n=1 Tax=Polypedilum vanderplanki TaxID=319348 RepID=A0A9J6CDC8_POLVA|nr:hypothetical protein PVAND_009634 [Polypedilum vanderplanki]
MNPLNNSINSLQNEIGQWEHALNNNNNGNDPLDLWWKYICWLENHQELEAKFRKTVEQCLSIYDKYEIYKQDLRLVKLYIKYIDFQPNPLNLYKILYQQGIGTKCAAFYIGWAHYYNSANHFKQAESIYNLGVQLKAEPLNELETAQKNFRFSVAQRMLYNDESSKKRTISSLEEQRQQITSLSPHQIHSAKRMRSDSQNDQYNTTTNSQQYANNHEYNNYNNSNYNSNVSPNDASYAICSSLSYVYDDSNGYASMEEQPQQHQKPITYTFNCGFQMPPNFINYARNSDDPWNVPLCLEEPYDPNRRCYYPKKSVYSGDDCEYSIEELKAHKWRLKIEEKRREEEMRRQREYEEKLQKEQQEKERLRQETEAKRQREEQERIRKEQEAQRIKMEQDKLQRQREDTERLRRQQEEEQMNRYNQSQMYQMQQQQQQRWNYHQQQQHSPANYPPNYHHGSYYHQSPQSYSYSHDHQYQTQTNMYSQSNMYHSPHYQNSPNYAPQQQSVIVNRTHYENHQYYMNYPTHSPVHQSQVPLSPYHHHQQQPPSHIHHSPHQMPHQQQMISHPNQISNEPNKTLMGTQQHQQNLYNNQTQSVNHTKSHYNEPDYQDVEYLIDHQAEIDPKMLQQPIIEGNSKEYTNGASDESESYEDDDDDEEEEEDDENEEEQIPTIVNSYMLDDLEEQIEASTISFSSNGKSRDKKITIKFRKEKTTTTIINSESNSESSQSQTQQKIPLESTSTTSSINEKKKKKKNKDILSSYDGENTQFMPSATNSCSSTNNGETNNNQNISFSKITFNGCVTPIRKPGASKTSTPISTYKYLKNKSSFISNQNDDSLCSYNGDQNSFFQAENDDEYKSRRLEKALATIDEHMKKRDIDPFNSELCRAFLTKLNFPNPENSNDYTVTNVNLPKLIKNQTVPISGISYQIEKEVGRGAYGAVFRGINLMDGSAVALKYQRPSNMATWELYICTELKNRIKNADILPGFMTISAAVIAPNASVLISEFSQYGSLLDINNRIRTATTKVMHESLVMHFSSQILNIVAHLHDCKIIHADIKPDNWLLMTLPSADTHIPSLRLIDFGCAIDMTLFKEGQEFRKIIETDGFTCVEMQEGRLWSYQTDLFCVAGTIHVMLFGEYMQVNKKFGQWEIKQKFPRYLNKTLWTDIFSKLLNIKDSNNLPKLRQMKAQIDREINDNELVKHIRTVSNLIRKR